MAPALTQRRADVRRVAAVRHRDEQRRAVEGAVRHRDEFGERRAARAGFALQPETRTLHISTSVTIASAAARETTNTGSAGRMVGALDERQPRDDLRRGVEFERGPPGAAARGGEAGTRPRSPFDSDTASTTPAAPMCGTNGTVKPKWKRALSRIAASPAERSACTRERRLHIGEGRDDDAPDALGGVERQDARDGARPAAASCRPRAPAGTPSRIPGVFLTAISRSMISPRSISRRCIASSMRSISLRRSARRAGVCWACLVMALDRRAAFASMR